MLHSKIINPLNVPDWDEMVSTFREEANVFHTAGWARTLAEAYRYEPHYVSWWQDHQLKAVLAIMEVKSALTGLRGVSLPFTDFCLPLGAEHVPKEERNRVVIDHGRSRNWKTLETRGAVDRSPTEEAEGPSFLAHVLELSPSEETLFAKTRSNTRRNLRKAEREGVTVVEENSIKGLSAFCKLNSITRREHGLPAQPRSFFDRLFSYIIQPGNGKILLGLYEGQAIAGAVFLSFNGNAIYKYGASDKRYQWLRANNLIMWKAISIYAQNGARTFHFGRTELGHSGLLQFKRGWGAEEKDLYYEKADIQSGEWKKVITTADGIHNRIFSRMPLFALNVVGKVLYRHMG